MKYIKLTQERRAKVDDADYETANKYKWHAVFVSGNWYANRKVRVGPRSENKTVDIRLHRFLLNPPAGYVVDHIDGDGLNCQRSNMRICTNAQNACNRKREIRNRSGYKGVEWHKQSKKWRASVKIEGKTIHLGSFDSPLDAAYAYDAGARKYHGEFARPNFED